MAEVPPPQEEILLTHFIVSDDVERSRRFYTEVLGGRVAFSSPGGPTNVALSNSWIVINAGGGPTDDKPEVTLETPGDPNRVSSFVNIRVKDMETVYSEWSARGAQFLTPPKQHQYEIRCYIRDPDGHLIEVGQTTDPQGDWVPDHWPSSTPADELPTPPEGIVLAHFIVSDDVERSRRFYTDVLGGRDAFSGPGGLTYVQLSNSWIIINVGGGPTDDKPEVTLETPADPNRVSSFLNIRVTDMHAVYTEWSARGAEFLTPPKQHQYEIRCYIRDPDGHLIEVGQTTHFIVSDDVERSRRFYTDVLGGTDAFPGPGGLTYCSTVEQLDHHQRRRRADRRQTGGHPRDARRSQPGQQLPQYTSDGHARCVHRMERARCGIPDATEAAPVRNPLLYPRSRWSSDRSGTNDGPGGRLVPRSMAIDQVGVSHLAGRRSPS